MKSSMKISITVIAMFLNHVARPMAAELARVQLDQMNAEAAFDEQFDGKMTARPVKSLQTTEARVTLVSLPPPRYWGSDLDSPKKDNDGATRQPAVEKRVGEVGSGVGKAVVGAGQIFIAAAAVIAAVLIDVISAPAWLPATAFGKMDGPPLKIGFSSN